MRESPSASVAAIDFETSIIMTIFFAGFLKEEMVVPPVGRRTAMAERISAPMRATPRTLRRRGEAFVFKWQVPFSPESISMALRRVRLAYHSATPARMRSGRSQ